MRKLKTTQNIILGWTERDYVSVRVCVYELQYSSQEGQGSEPVVMSVAPCQGSVCRKTARVCAKWNRECVCVHVLQSKCVCVCV